MRDIMLYLLKLEISNLAKLIYCYIIDRILMKDCSEKDGIYCVNVLTTDEDFYNMQIEKALCELEKNHMITWNRSKTIIVIKIYKEKYNEKVLKN